MLLILCVILADRPPDRHHPFGHGRFEPIAGLQLGFLLVVFGGVMTYKQICAALEGGHTGVINPNAWIIPLVAIILLELAYRHLKKTAKLRNSPALLSDAVHYRLDAINSLFAMFALVIAAYVPKYSQVIDHIGAVLIAILMITVGTIAAKENMTSS
jgi:cation diffusion facilitator family transporter